MPGNKAGKRVNGVRVPLQDRQSWKARALLFFIMILTFDRARMNALLAHTKAAKKWKALYKQPETAAPGLWLVGDYGVYFMANAEPGLMDPVKLAKDPKSTSHYVCYARECDPEKCAFNEWWSAKQETFGGSDGVEFIPAETIESWLATTPAEMTYVGIILKGESMTFVVPE